MKLKDTKNQRDFIMDTVLDNGIVSARISSLGAQLLSFKDNTTEYIWQRDENVWNFSAPVLFPICGALNNGSYTYNGIKYEMEQHGFARFKEFTLEKATPVKACYLLKSDEETKKNYPFDFEFRVVFELDQKRLNITYSVINLSDGNMYFSFGGHEGYDCPEGVEDYVIEFENDTTLTRHMHKIGFFDEKTEKMVLKGGELALRYKEFERCTYVFRDINSESVILKNNSRKIRVGFPKHNVLVIWTKPERKYVCIEPWCGVFEKEGFDGDITKKDCIVELKPFQCFERTHFAEIL